MLSKRVYMGVLKPYYVSSCPIEEQWDQCAAFALKQHGMMGVYPTLPRTVHVPYSSGKHAPLVGLELNLQSHVEYPNHKFLGAILQAPKSEIVTRFKMFTPVKRMTGLQVPGAR